ncbi:MAG: hypothetical protein ABIT37_06675 [Luteolibacter sp.]
MGFITIKTPQRRDPWQILSEKLSTREMKGARTRPRSLPQPYGSRLSAASHPSNRLLMLLAESSRLLQTSPVIMQRLSRLLEPFCRNLQRNWRRLQILEDLRFGNSLSTVFQQSADRMKPQRWCDFDKLVATVSGQFPAGPHSIHGPTHWKRVEQNGLWLATQTGADTLVTRLFAWFHDSKRENENNDPQHGKRGAEYAASLRGKLFDLEDSAFESLIHACTWHTDEIHSLDNTIGTCWDSDRLDLGRVGMIPSPEFMSTEFGKEVADIGSFFPFMERINSTGIQGDSE